MDYPRNIAVPSFINTVTRWMGGMTHRQVAGFGVPSSQSWTANVAVYIPLLLPWHYSVKRAFWYHGSAVSGHVDIGIYTKSGALIWSAGSTVNAGSASQPQYVTPSQDLLLQPGRYWMAYTHDGTTNQYLGAPVAADKGRLSGIYQQASAHPLPATATFAAYAGVGVPLIGITNTASGF